MSTPNRVLCTAAIALIFCGTVSARDPSLMHCFAFTPVAGASAADWDSFYKATDALPSQTSAVKHVWYGKLQNPLNQYQVDEEASKKLRAGGKDVPAKANRQVREYGVCLEMTDAAALKAYADSPVHATWLKAYEKVRVEGTTTFNILGR